MLRMLTLSACCLCVVGCQSSAPIHVWQPPRLASTVGKQVVLSSISGPEELTEPLREQLIFAAPSDPGRVTDMISVDRLPQPGTIQLVSAFDDEPNDLVLASMSRQSGAEFLLRGEIVQPNQPALSSSALRLSWRLLSLNDGGHVAGMPVVVDSKTILERHPDLACVEDTQQQLLVAAARDTYQLVTPWVDRQSIRLSKPYLMPGSREVRRGIRAARAGRWGEAEAIWELVSKRHPTQIAALHNLALAAAAGQDFSRARELARRAVRLNPTALHQNTMVWVELLQRDYHKAFGLPDPPEGWFISRP